MTEQRAPTRPIPAAVVVARRAMVIAAASTVIAALAVVIALLGDPGSDPSDSAALQQARDEAAAARTEADAATAMANAATVIAEEAAAKAALAEEALVEALIEARAATDPEAIARLEAQLVEVRNLAATALVATEASAAEAEADGAADDAAGGGAAADDAADGAADDDSAAVEDDTEPEEEDVPPSQDAAPEETAPEPDEASTAAAAELPGEPFELGPSAGSGLAVVGIGHESALNLRDAPGGEIIARLDNVMDGGRDPAVYVRDPASDDIIATVDLRRGLVATGNTRMLPTTIWHELRVAELLGWASSAYLAPLGADRDATGEVEEALGETPTAETLIDLGRQVSALYESTGEVQSRTTISSRPGVFEALGDITLDVIGLPDDAVRGYRINITADSGAEDWTQGDGGPFTLRSVTVTPICVSYRGVSDEGLCE